MPSVLQIVDYAKKHLHDLIQVDSTKNDDAILAKVPDIFVPIRDGSIKPEDIKYIFAKQFGGDKKNIYRMIALRDFEATEGVQIRIGSIGGLVDVKTYFGHKDKSWVDYTSMVLASSVVGESLISRESEVKNCIIKNSTIEDSELRDGVRVENSQLKDVVAEGSCSITKSEVYSSILVDRAHVETSKVTGSRLTFCNVNDSKLIDEKVMGDSSTLNMAKVYDYETMPPKVPQNSRLNSIFDFFKNKKNLLK